MRTHPDYDPDDPECLGECDPDPADGEEARARVERLDAMTEDEAEEDARLEMMASRVEAMGEDAYAPRAAPPRATRSR